MQLRPYQLHCLSAVHAAWKAGTQRVLAAIPTGGGKTAVFSRVPRLFPGRQTMFLAHREELLDQAAAELAAANPTLSIGIEQAHRRTLPTADIVVASVPTIGKKGSPRLLQFDPARFGAVVVDEAHHAGPDNESYRVVLDHFGCFQEGGARLLGVTATPFRGDGTNLGATFETIAYQTSILDLIDEKYLCPVRAFAIQTHVEIDQVGSRYGDFKEKDLADAVDVPLRNIRVVDSWRQLAGDRRRTLVFAVDVHHTYALRDEWRKRGVVAEAILGETPDDERKRITAAYHAGEIPVVVNCGVWLEGFNSPGIDTVVMARPTKSPLLFAQAIGRGTRTAPGKEDLVILDFVDNTKRHKIVTAASLFGMPGGMDLEGKDVREAKKVVDELARADSEANLDLLSSMSEALARAAKLRELLEKNQARVAVERQAVNIFSRTRAATPFSPLSWIEMPDKTFHLGLPDRTYVKLGPDLLGNWTAYHWPKKEKVAGADSQAGGFQTADKWIRDIYPDALRQQHRGAAWRKKPATPAQLDLIERWMGKRPDPTLSKGAASDLISSMTAERDAKWNGPPSEGQCRALRRLGEDPDDYRTFREASQRLDQRREARS